MGDAYSKMLKVNKEKYSIEGQCGKMRFGASNIQGWSHSNKDRYIAQSNISKGISIFGVFDGHAGKEVAVYLKRHFTEELLKCEAFLNGDYGSTLVETFQRMEDLINGDESRKEIALIRADEDETKADLKQPTYAGSSGCVALLVNNELYIANLGDSECALFSNGEVISLSQEHRPDLDSEKSRIEKAQGSVIEGRVDFHLGISRAIGFFSYKQDTNLPADKQLVIAVPDIRKRTLKEKDELLVIGSRGFWGCATQEQILEFLREQIQKHNSPLKAIDELMDKILPLEYTMDFGCSNMTCIVVMLR